MSKPFSSLSSCIIGVIRSYRTSLIKEAGKWRKRPSNHDAVDETVLAQAILDYLQQIAPREQWDTTPDDRKPGQSRKRTASRYPDHLQGSTFPSKKPALEVKTEASNTEIPQQTSSTTASSIHQRDSLLAQQQFAKENISIMTTDQSYLQNFILALHTADLSYYDKVNFFNTTQCPKYLSLLLVVQ